MGFKGNLVEFLNQLLNHSFQFAISVIENAKHSSIRLTNLKICTV